MTSGGLLRLFFYFFLGTRVNQPARNIFVYNIIHYIIGIYYIICKSRAFAVQRTMVKSIMRVQYKQTTHHNRGDGEYDVYTYIEVGTYNTYHILYYGR